MFRKRMVLAGVVGMMMGMTVICAILPAAISTPLYAQTKDGFKGRKWGTTFAEMQKEFDLRLIENGNTKFYSSNVKSIGNAQLQQCAFCFYNGRFSDVIIITKGPINSRNLLAILKEAYGQPRQPNEYIEEYYWFNIGDTAIIYDENSITGDANAHFFSRSIADEEEADNAQKSKKGVGEL